MSHKSPKIAALIADCADDPRYDAHYKGYFKCFNNQLYYEAHDVLEELWLIDRSAPKANYYKGLIQLAGAFVHMQKNRLEPAFRLFHLAINNFSQYPDIFEGHDIGDTRRRLANEYMQALQAGKFSRNPWSPETAPKLELF